MVIALVQGFATPVIALLEEVDPKVLAFFGLDLRSPPWLLTVPVSLVMWIVIGVVSCTGLDAAGRHANRGVGRIADRLNAWRGKPDHYSKGDVWAYIVVGSFLALVTFNALYW